MTSSVTFVWTPWAIAIGCALVFLAATLSLLAWKRSGFAPKTACLETLRTTIVVLVAITLNQPEWTTIYEPEQRPVHVVLQDTSGSMQTRDVINAADRTRTPQTRRQWAEQLADRRRWQGVSRKLDVVFESFSSRLPDPSEGTDLYEALVRCLENHEHLRGVTLISDGDWNTGEPPVRAASRLNSKNLPVFAVAVGSESRLPDIELVRADAPTFGVVGKPLRIPFIIDSALPRDLETTVTLQPSAGELVSKTVTLPAMGRLEETLLWRPAATGDFELTLRVPVHNEELIADNNERTVPISIRKEALKVLLVESVPRWEYRYLRNALERDPGVDVRCLLLHPRLARVGGGKGYISAFPTTMEELSTYDVVVLGDVGLGAGELTSEQCRLIKGLVESQASGLIFMPGVRGAQSSLLDTELEALYPVVLDSAQPRGWGSRIPSQLELTTAGRRSLLTRLEDAEDENALLWEAFPGFQWYAAVTRAKAGSEVLAVHKTEVNHFGRIPLLVTRTYGTGKILFMGTDGAWRWREGVEDKYHYRFWGQVTRWMAYQRSMAEGESMRLFFSPDRPQPAESVTLNANVASTAGGPLQAGTVMVQIVAPSGKIEHVRLAPQNDEWGLFTSSFIPQERGRYRLTLTCRENASTLDTTLDVQGTVLERVGRPARFDVLREIAEVTRGKMVLTSEIGAMFDAIVSLPAPDPMVRRVRLWCHPAWVGMLVFLLAVFWVGRKMVGVV